MPGIKAFIFDLDGVVADTAAAHLRSWRRLADEHGFAFDDAARDAVLGRTREDSLRLIVGDVDAATTAEWLQAKQDYFLAELAAMGPDDALPGVVDLLHDARARGLGIALASSSRNARGVLRQLQIADLFDVVADGATVAHPKPAPDIFLWCAHQLGRRPDECVVFEDANAGIEAAVAGGFGVVAIANDDRRATWHRATLRGTRAADFFGVPETKGTLPAL